MPVLVDIFDFKCFNQLRNGELFDQNLSEFTPNLVGNIGEKVKVEFKANVSQTSNTEGVEEWNIVEIVDDASIEIERGSGSFLDDNIQVGDSFTYYNDWINRKVNVGSFTGVIRFISSDGKLIRFDTIVFIPPSTGIVAGIVTNVGLVFDQLAPENINTAFFLKFGLLGNDETFNYLSKTTEAPQVYYRGELVTTPTPTLVEAESLGSIKDWVTGRADVGLLDTNPDLGAAQYTITHEFVLAPFYILSYRQFIEAGTIPDILKGDSSIKYAAELEFRKTLTNTGSSKIQSFDNLDGFVGWYGENFNGLNNKYQISSISYEEISSSDPLDGVNINSSTRATIRVINTGGAITAYSCSVYLFKVPDSEDDYIGTTTDLLENFLFKSEIVSSPATSTPNVTTSLSLGDLIIEYDIDYTTAQKLQLTTDDEYILLVQVEDPTIAAGNSDRVMLLADFRNYVDIDFLAGFVNVNAYNILQHLQDIGDTGSAIQVLSNEDGILLDAVIGTDVSKEVIINSISVDLIAYSASLNKSFALDQYSFNLGEQNIVNGSSEINVDSLRGYPLPDGDEFNFAKAKNLSIVSGFQQYSIQLGQKIKWQDWIFNPLVDNAFFDASQPNNNLNEKSSNYSDEQTYQIKLALTVNVTGLDDLGRLITGDFINFGVDLSINDYGESVDSVSGVIQTFDQETGNSLEGNILYNGKDTLFRAVFSNAAAMQYGIHRIEPSQNQGDGILELSSVRPSVQNNLLKPVDGETQLTFDLVGSDLTTECLIDGSLIQEGINYKLSARVAAEPLILENAFTFTIDTSNAGSAADKFQLPFIDTGIYDVLVDKGNGDPLIPITVWNAPETLLDYASTGAGSYEVKIYGLLRGWSFNIAGDILKMLNISQWGTFQPTVGNSFNGCANMDVTATDAIDLSQTTTLTGFFRDCDLTSPSDYSVWDVSGITDMTETFRGNANFTGNIDNWNVSNVTTLLNTFFGCTNFNTDIGSWNLSSCDNISGLFTLASTFNQDIGGWNVSSVTTLFNTFNFASAFNQDISGWNVGNVNSLRNTFAEADAFNQPLNSWNTSSVLNMSGTFRGANVFNQPLNLWDVSNVTNFNQAFFNAAAFDQPLDSWTVSAGLDMGFMFASTPFNQSLNSWNVSNVTNMSLMFNQASNFNGNITSWNVSSVLDMSSMFLGASSFNQNIGGWNVSSVANFSGMFNAASAFNQNIGGWTTTAATNMSSMFNTATLFDQDLSGWDVSSVTVMLAMFTSSALGTVNYDLILVGWEAQAVQNGVVVSFGTAQYSAGAPAAARAALIADHSWIITDGGPV